MRKDLLGELKNPTKEPDWIFFLISNDSLGMVPTSNIHSNYKGDHSMISLDLRLSSNQKGRGSWKCNNNLLKNKDFVKLIKDEIQDIKHIYALPVYRHETVDILDDHQLELMISDSLFFDVMLCQLRGSIISFAKRISREKRKEENSLEVDIEKLILEIDTCESFSHIEVLNRELYKKQAIYEDLRENRMRGHMVRSRSEITANWEKPSKYFLNLEKKPYINKTILELSTEDGEKVTDPKKILKLQEDFYRNLFTSKKTIKIENSYYEPYLCNLKQLSQNMKQKLDETFSIDELENVIKKSKLNKAPGPDGYTNEFLIFFWMN